MYDKKEIDLSAGQKDWLERREANVEEVREEPHAETWPEELEDSVCKICNGTGIVEAGTTPYNLEERACVCQEEDDFSGASEGDR